jgi:CRP-like cAMP-binding protein
MPCSLAPPLLTANRLLAALPRRLHPPMLACLEPVVLPLAHVLVVPGARMRHVYFPTAGVVALLAQVNDHPPVAVGMVGAEGLVGLSMVCGERVAAVGAIVQVAGTALRLSAQARRPGGPLWGALQVLVGRYTGALVLQLAQQAACSQFHGLEARLGRWLLMTHDRAPAEAWQLTQHFLATLLGVRRESVTQAAHRLQARQLIDYRRGQLRLLDRPGLARVACPCYVQMQADDGRTSPHRR